MPALPLHTEVMQVPAGVGLPAVFEVTPTETMQGELVCLELLYESDPCRVSCSVTRPVVCSSKPRTRYVGPFTPKVVLP